MKYKNRTISLILLFAFFLIDSFINDSPTLQVEGIIVNEGKAIKGAVINVIYNSKIESQTISRRNGRFDFSLDYGKEYTIEASKDGFITKKIIISTRIDDDIINAGGVTEGFFDLQITMIEMVPGLNILVYNQPVRKYEFDRNSWLFYPDMEFENPIKEELEKVNNQLSVLKQNVYNNQIKLGDDFMNKSDYEDAWMAYNQALKYFPRESYPKSQIKKINKAIKAMASTEEDYKKAIEQGDYYYSNENFRMAASYYEKALLYKPDENYPTLKINDIDSIYNQIFIERKTAYDKAITIANEHLDSKDYGNAMIFFNEALNILPDEQYPKIKLSEIDESYKKIVSVADSLYEADNLANAKEFYKQAGFIKPDDSYPAEMIEKIDKSVDNFEQEEADRIEREKLQAAEKAQREKELAEEKAQKEKELAAEKAESEKELKVENEYNNIVAQADGLLAKNDLINAERLYVKALSMKPDEKYPKRKIEEIEELIIEKESEEASRKQKEILQKKDSEYNKLLKNAEDMILKEEYEKAKEELLKASKIKPDEKYPDRRIKDIDKLMLEAKEKEEILAEESKTIPGDIDSAEFVVDTKEQISRYMEILKEKKQSGDKDGESKVLNDIGNIYHNNNRLGTAIDYYTKSLEIKKEAGDKEGVSVVLNDIAVAFYDSGKFETAVDNYKESYRINEEMGNKKVSAVILDNIGQVYENTYRYENAVRFYEQSLDIVEELGEKKEQAALYNKLANVYVEQNDPGKAVENYKKSLDIDKVMNKEEDVAATLNNIGSAYYNMGNINEAEDYYEQSLTETKKIGDRKQTSIALNNIGNINYDGNKLRKAIDFYKQSIEIKKEIDYKRGEAASLHNLGNAYKGLKEYSQAIDYYKKSNEVAGQINYLEVMARNNRAFSEVYSLLNDYKKAYEYQKLFAELKQNIEDDKSQIFEGLIKERREDDLVLISSLRRQIQKQKLLAEYEANRRKKEIEIKNLELENEKEKTRRQQLIIFVSLAGLLVLIVFSILICRQYFQKKKANIVLMEKNRLISYQKQQITDSITYASRIQKAVLPPNEFITRVLPQHFILNKPRDIVSGDYYWTTQRGNESIIAVADCTGHGVPGAFMSMLGIAFLNEIVNKNAKAKSHEILDQLRTNVMASLHQTGREDEAKDGMDIALIIVDLKKKVLQYSGAHNPLYMIRKGKMQEVKADKMPIGISSRYNKPFKNHRIELLENDMIYIFSDGYQDQFGGENRKKFGIRRFRELLLEIHNKPMDEQKEILENTITGWKGNFDQIDDILVMGMRI